MDGWAYVDAKEPHLITVPDWVQAGVNVAFSTRNGGVSTKNYRSLNLGLHVGDNEESVIENRSRLLGYFGASLDETVCCQQIHGNQVIRVDLEDRGKGSRSLDDVLADADAMITDVPGIYLLSFYADCVPVYYWDPEHRAIGTAHCGWKGTIGKICLNTLEAMQTNYGTDVARVQIFIGPGIGVCCYQIQPDLATRVMDELPDMHDIITETSDSGYYWDLQSTNQQLLQQKGVLPANINVCRLCTSCRTDLFFSFRQEKGITGRMGALIGINN